MKNILAVVVVLSLLLSPKYMASSNQEELTSLTKEQQKLQKQISNKTEDITEAQIELDTLNSTIESNQAQIESLNSQVKDKQKDLDNQTENLKSTLSLMQRLSNRNAMVEYLASDNEDNFLLRINNIMELSDAIQKNIQVVVSDIKEINKAIDSANSYQSQNKENQAKVTELLEEQEKIETELREQLSEVDSEVLNVQTQISLEEAQAKQKAQEEATAKAEAEAKAEADKEANNVVEETTTEEPEVVEPEEPEVVEPEEPEVVEPEEPEVVEPEEPEVVEPEEPEVVEPEEPEVVEPEEPEVVEPEEPDTGSQYPSDGNVSGYKSQLLAAAGISSSDMTYVDYIVTKESGWNYLATNSVSGAYGLCQALPGSKMSSAGSDWATNPETQLSWCNSYAVGRYGSWEAAYNFWLDNNWW